MPRERFCEASLTRTQHRPFMNNRVLALMSVFAVGLTALGVYIANKYFAKAPESVKPPEVATALTRGTIPLPKVPFTDVTAQAHIAARHYNGAGGKKLLPETMG